MDWFTSDLHLGHANVISFSERPFADIDEMDSALIRNINERVGMHDTLWILGDVAFRATEERVRAALDRLVCKDVRVVRGNHDRSFTPYLQESLIVELKSLDRRFVLCHYPMLEWVSYYRGAIHVHGHIHTMAGENETSDYNLQNREQGILRYDVGVDANHYAPISAAQILEFFSGIDTSARTPWSSARTPRPMGVHTCHGDPDSMVIDAL